VHEQLQLASPTDQFALLRLLESRHLYKDAGMAKDKSASAKLAKAERKAAKAERKAEKLAQKAGVSKKSSGDKKEKKEKRKALAERALNEIEGGSKKEKRDDDEDEEDEDDDDDEEEMEVSKANADDEDEDDDDEGEVNGTKMEEVAKGKKSRESLLAARPVGALVPFANPLADDKAAKKVFKCVKKGKSVLSHSGSGSTTVNGRCR
jgi:hypothetical protein